MGSIGGPVDDQDQRLPDTPDRVGHACGQLRRCPVMRPLVTLGDANEPVIDPGDTGHVVQHALVDPQR
jgi:hypothetical protein